MELLLIRHALACKRDPLRWKADALRPLSPRGMRRFRRAAAGLKRLVEPPALVISSPLAAVAPGGSTERLLARLSGKNVDRLAVIGHEPELGRLLACCLGGSAARISIEFRKGAVACVAFDSDVMAGRGSLRWLMPPRALRRLAD
jgi:phosphohistidine phosphatase